MVCSVYVYIVANKIDYYIWKDSLIFIYINNKWFYTIYLDIEQISLISNLNKQGL